jgi:putative endonuclease
MFHVKHGGAPFDKLKERLFYVDAELVDTELVEVSKCRSVEVTIEGIIMKKGYIYILKCSDGTYYTGSTTNLELRLAQHKAGEGANYIKKRLPVELVYNEEYSRIDDVFYREKQIQGWRKAKKEALIKDSFELLPALASSVVSTSSGSAFFMWTLSLSK